STSRIAPSSPAAPCRTGSTTSGGSAASRSSRRASASRATTSTPADRSASATRRPERSDTSRSYDSPPDSTTTCPSSATAGSLGEVGSGVVGTGSAAGRDGAEGVAQLHLLLDHRGETPDALADPGGFGVTEGQPQMPVPGAVGVEAGARDVGDAA